MQSVSQLTTLGNVVEDNPKEVVNPWKGSTVNNMTITQKENYLPIKELPQMFQQGDGRRVEGGQLLTWAKISGQQSMLKDVGNKQNLQSMQVEQYGNQGLSIDGSNTKPRCGNVNV